MMSLEMRGLNDYDWAPDARYLLSDLVADFSGIVNALGSGDLNICGLSFGGPVSFVYAGEHPSASLPTIIGCHQSRENVVR